MNITKATRILSSFALTIGIAACDSSSTPTSSAPGKNIVDIASSDTSFSTLVVALKKAGLVTTLQGAGPFTVFAPTNAAFAKLPMATLAAALADSTGLLKQVLLYHVVAGKVTSAQVVGMTSATTVQGSSIAISVVGGKVVLNGSATVTTADIQASNGIIHVIDNVLLPPAN